MKTTLSLDENCHNNHSCDKSRSVLRGINVCFDCYGSGSACASCNRLRETGAGLFSAPLNDAKRAARQRAFAAVQSENTNDVTSCSNPGVLAEHVEKHVCFVLENESLFGAPDSVNDDDSNTSVYSNGSNENVGLTSTDKNTFTFFSWNVEGLYPKLFDDDFLSYITSFDFVCLTETFIVNFNFDMFTEHEFFFQPAVRLSAVDGRPSGGVACLIRKQCLPFIRQIKIDVGNFLLFIIDKSLFGLDKDVLYVCAYVPPEGSRYYGVMGLESDGVSVLENVLVDNVLLDNDLYVIITGDLNSRTGNVSQPVTVDNDVFDEMHHNFDIFERRSQDSIINGFGKTLLNMCTSLNLCIINGMCYGDQQGRYTYVCDRGCSVIDYILMSSDLFATLFDLCSLNVVGDFSSKHMPIVFSVLFPKENENSTEIVKEKIFVEKYVWQDEKSEQYNNAFLTDRLKLMLDEAIQLIYIDCNLALERFNAYIIDAASCMRKRMCLGVFRNKLWFDNECHNKRKEVRKLLKKFRRTNNSTDRENYCRTRREYKYLLDRKKKDHNRNIINRLVASIDKQNEFWQTLKNICPKKKSTRNQIKLDEWYNYFKTLLDKDTDENVDPVYDDELENAAFNRPISEEEILFAITRLKCGKAAGPDKIVSDFLKNASVFIIPFLVKFLNEIFDKGIYPNFWSESIILPLYKKGNVNNPSNYRGISLSDASSKIYGIIINNRIQKWVDQNNITGEQQGGFKSGYSCVDHVFTLLACVQKQFNNNRKLYVAFIDFEKCFDTINRNLLWPILIKNGIKGKLFKCIRSMYSSVKARIRCGNSLTEQIQCTLGVKQGDNCSPVLFSLFINELALEVIRNGRHGASFLLDPYELFILLLADDVALISETPIGLQIQLNNLCRSAKSLKLKVNLSKSNIVVFRKGGYLGRRENWTFDGSNMPVVNAYKYLGLYLSTKLSFSAACRDIASKAKRALLFVMQRLRQHNNYSVDVFFRIFDSKIQPIMQYGSEVWGLEQSSDYCEKIHLYALKKFLCVSMRTPNDFVYKELNRYPITINSGVNCLRYWLKLVHMDHHRLPYKAYKSLYTLDERNKQTWVTNIRKCLCENGFAFVWFQQGVGNAKLFLREFKQRLIDGRWQKLNEHINESERFDFYNTFCERNFVIPVYLKLDINQQYKYIMSKFRFGISKINTHHLRYKNVNQRAFYCPYCKNVDENEFHFVLVCPLFDDLRKQYLPEKYFRTPNHFRLTLLLNNRSESIVENLCKFIYHAFKIRGVSTE